MTTMHKLVTVSNVWSGCEYPAGTELVVDNTIPPQIYKSNSFTNAVQTALTCWRVVGGQVTSEKLTVWDNEVRYADFPVTGSTVESVEV